MRYSWSIHLFAICSLSACGDLVISESDISIDASVDAIAGCSTDDECDDNPACLVGSCTNGQCAYIQQSNTCYVDGACFVPGQEKPGDRCQLCDPATPTEFTPKDCSDGRICDPQTGECILAGALDPGAPCTSSDICQSGLCVPLGDGSSVCSDNCAEDADCPAALTCGTDGTCVDARVNACRPCTDSIECASTGAALRCAEVVSGEGSYCLVPCSSAADCAANESCVDPDGSGLVCVPNGNACQCNQRAIDDAASTPCESSGCTGTRTCTQAGLTACDTEAGAEICDGDDNDCDGAVDEDFKDEDGLYATDAHCGACNASCEGTVANGVATCQVADGEASCTFDSCLPGFIESSPGVCSLIPDSGSCAVCSSSTDCDAGFDCVALTAASFCLAPCTDGADNCDSGYVCGAVSGAGNYCLLAGGGCAGQGSACSDALQCDDGNPCSVGTCDGGSCSFVNAADDSVCDNGDPCFDSFCFGGVCTDATINLCTCVTAADCDPSSQGLSASCTSASCTDNECVFTSMNEGQSCDDEDACTETTTCQAGVCEGAALTCDDGESCTSDGCDPASGCTYVADDSNSCDDGSPCTTDACSNGQCVGSPIDCSAFDDACNTGICDASTGDCKKQAVADETECDDGDSCTVNDQCTSGICAGGDLDCSALNGPCEVGVCNPASGQCAIESIACGIGSAQVHFPGMAFSMAATAQMSVHGSMCHEGPVGEAAQSSGHTVIWGFHPGRPPF